MKVTKEKRDEIRRSLVSAAVELFSKQGLSETSLREIAARAGVAPGTVYKYFPTREQIFYAYFEIKQKDASAALEEIAGFDSFSFKEKLQAYVEALLSAYVEDREFVAVAMEGLIESPLKSYGALRIVKQQLVDVVERFFADAIAKGEIRDGEYNTFLTHLFWDYTNLVLIYWLKDESDHFAQTSEFVDITLDLYVELAQAAVVEKGAKVVSYLLRSHLYANLDRFLGLVSVVGSQGMGRMNRRDSDEHRDDAEMHGAKPDRRSQQRVPATETTPRSRDSETASERAQRRPTSKGSGATVGHPKDSEATSRHGRARTRREDSP